MKLVKSQAKKAVEAVEAIKDLENKTGVKVQTGLRAGNGGDKKGGGPVYQPLYGAPVDTE